MRTKQARKREYYSWKLVFCFYLLVFIGAFQLGATHPAETTEAMRVESVVGLASVYSGDGKHSRPVEAGTVLDFGESIVTSDMSRVYLRTSMGHLVELEPLTSMQLPVSANGDLELNYGAFIGHVAGKSSTLEVRTVFGKAILEHGSCQVKSFYRPALNSYFVAMKNRNGKLSVVSSYLGVVDYGRSSLAKLTYQPQETNEVWPYRHNVPAVHTLVLSLGQEHPRYTEMVDHLVNCQPKQVAQGPLPFRGDSMTDVRLDSDSGVIVVSPSGPVSDSL